VATILYLDIETAPNLGYTWEMYEQNVLGFVKQSYMLCYAYAWNDGKVKVQAISDFPGYTKNKSDDKALVQSLWELFNKADVIIAHNGKRFDIRYINGRFLYHGLQPPHRYQVIDTLTVARGRFKLNSNKLNDLGKLLNVGKKVETGGFELWEGCMDGDMAAWKKMKKYNKQDVVLLREVYKKLRAWANNHPNLNVIDDVHRPQCSHCQSQKVWKLGTEAYGNQVRQRWRCTDCGANLYTGIKGKMPLK
jgi:DNA polymerase elongation subunit (family B)